MPKRSARAFPTRGSRCSRHRTLRTSNRPTCSTSACSRSSGNTGGSMNEKERRDAGMRIRRAVLGNAHVDKAEANATPLTAEFQDLITRYAWGEIWTRPGLDVRTRRILVLGTLIALGRFDEFRLHARAALVEGGFSLDDLKEIVLQQAIYCGVPAANTAFHALNDLAQRAQRTGSRAEDAENESRAEDAENESRA